MTIRVCFILFFILGIINIRPVSYSLLVSEEKERVIIPLHYTKDELYEMILNKQIDYKNKDIVEILTNWYDYFRIEDMFLTEDGEYVDYTTYQIYRVHLENQYKVNKDKILKTLLKHTNYPKQEDSELYEKYINEYIDTTGEAI